MIKETCCIKFLLLCSLVVIPFSLGAQQAEQRKKKIPGEDDQEIKIGQVGEVGFINHLGMRFVEISSESPLFSIWETRVADFKAFLNVSGRRTKQTYFKQRGDHPVVNVSWEDAIAFCSWLTTKELASGRLPKGCRYRLPTSAEWSMAVGMAPVSDDPLKELSVDSSASGYPWGKEWPPQKGAGNYHPELAVDDFAVTSPVGSFAANRYGLFDLGGNVWEWCQDQYGNSVDFRVLRGASWRMRTAGDLLSGFIIGNVTSLRLETYGFRVVLELPQDKRSEVLEILQSKSGELKKND